ncbi:GNAT family N-acetyltransferase [Bradyrhizobium sp. OAE829]|uniref:GNAT family N-acetyltransferase n=1 Tax=Bradyrhizobium sp. OAE829 TaxID=2663807 RepID=UPI00178A77F5
MPDKVAASLQKWHAFTAVTDGLVVGTASLSDHVVKSVFVHPDFQRRGVATRLMAAVESAAVANLVRRLDVQSSITAQPFYAKCGFVVVREETYGEERTIVMSKTISPTSE